MGTNIVAINCTPKTKFKFKAAPIESYTAKSLYEMKFQDAAKVIAKMDTMQKAYVASQAQEYLDCLYANANRFGNPDYPIEEQPSIAQFRGIMGKIKHWETIMFWLLEIDIMMQADDLALLAYEAEQEIEKLKQYEAYAPEKVAKEVAKREKVINKAMNTQAHTIEIMNQAAQLTAMFFSK